MISKILASISAQLAYLIEAISSYCFAGHASCSLSVSAPSADQSALCQLSTGHQVSEHTPRLHDLPHVAHHLAVHAVVLECIIVACVAVAWPHLRSAYP